MPLLTPGVVMAAALVLQRWEDAVLSAGPARAGVIVGQDGVDGLFSEHLRSAPQVAVPDPEP
ncbi:hypothetical protein [Amycolatopsis sp. NPDC049159]|uniref:hypothetical protein n=1 Tax=Amycolatopsis sp. NPDC049159 TaxID=3157210 RepID=UPI0033E9CAA1